MESLIQGEFLIFFFSLSFSFCFCFKVFLALLCHFVWFVTFVSFVDLTIFSSSK
jgi:hypothetical protein